MVKYEKAVKRFGPRYGRRTRLKYGMIERVQRSRQKCPYCNQIKVRRVSTGVWNCEKCGAKFTGKAYTV